jgi:hypothetical protein
MTIILPTPESAEAAYAQLSEEDRVTVDALGKELETALHARQAREAEKLGKTVKARVSLGSKMQRELVAKLYAFVKAKRESQTDSVPDVKKQPKTITAPPTGSTTVIQFKRVVNFYPAD